MKKFLTSLAIILLMSCTVSSLKAQTKFDLVIIFQPTATFTDITFIKTALNATQLDSTFPSRALLWRCSLVFPLTLTLPKLGGGTFAGLVNTPSDAVGVVCGTGQSEGVSNNDVYIIPQTDTVRESFTQAPPLFGTSCTAAATDSIVTCKPGRRAVKIAILDSGIDCDRRETSIVVAHDSLKPYVCVGQDILDEKDSDGNGYIDDLIGYDFVNNTGVPKDSTGHGTFVAGVISRILKRNSADNIKFFVLKVLDGKNRGFEYNFIRALDYAIKQKVEIVNCSFISSAALMDTMQPLTSAIYTARKFGVLISLAAGNNGKDIDQPVNWFGPAVFQNENTIVTGATACTDSVASFSNFAKKNVDIFAPGKGLVSTWIRTGVCATNCYAFNTGTSFVAPQTTAVAALLASNLAGSDWLRVKCSILKSTTFKSFLVNKCRRAGLLNGAKASTILTGANAPCDDITAVTELENTRTFEAYPNPFRDIVTLNFSLLKATPVEVNIFNMTGALISKYQLIGVSGNNQHPLSIKGTEGIYFIHIQAGNDVLIKKIIKTN